MYSNFVAIISFLIAFLTFVFKFASTLSSTRLNPNLKIAALDDTNILTIDKIANHGLLNFRHLERRG